MNIHLQLVGVVILCVVSVALADDPPYKLDDTDADVDDLLQEANQLIVDRMMMEADDDDTGVDLDDLVQEADQLLEDRMMMEADGDDEVAEELDDLPEDRIVKLPIGLFSRPCRLRTGEIVPHGKSVMLDCNRCYCRYGTLSCTKKLCPPPCVAGSFYMSLYSGRRYGSLQGVSVISSPKLNRNVIYRRNRCSRMALLRVNFEKLTSDEQRNPLGCLPVPYCGRRMLKIHMTLSSSLRGGHMFDFGDSATNDGYGGDVSTQTNDAELHGIYPRAVQYTSDRCKPAVNVEEIFANVLRLPATWVTVWISNEHVRVQNNAGVDRRVCSRCLWALNGQADSTGPENEDIYLAINRVIRRTNRYGVGICSVRLSWDCPSCMRSRPVFPFG